jgi:hypothetical protein
MMFVNKTTEDKCFKTNINYKSQSELDKIYVENNCSQFQKMISVILTNKHDHNCNSNIEPIFYDINEFTQLLENVNNELEPKWKTRIMIDNTSRGNVIMFFDVYKFGFSYYSDQNIPYFILNAAAMKYVKTFHCFDFFIDNQLLQGGSSPLLLLQNNPKEHIKTNKPDSKNALKNNNDKTFARFKKYNNLPNTPTPLITNKNIKIHKPEPVIEEFNRNKFMYLGKTMNLSVLKQTKVKESNMFFDKKTKFDNIFASEHNVQKAVLSYKEFKNIKTT